MGRGVAVGAHPRSIGILAQRLLGPYTIEERLATGGMAEVFVAKRSGAHGFFKRVALKRILPQLAKDPDFVQMFIFEARLAAQLDHPSIVQVFDFGELGGDLVLAMELVVGTNVNRLLRRVSVRGETVPLDVALHIASETARALAYAHRARDDEGEPLGIVHRDVSPANILLTHTGHVKLSDFGIARAAGRDSRTDRGHVRGKLGYMSPEQVQAKELTGHSDVFTLTTVFAEMLLAEPLFGTGSDIEVLLRIRDVDLGVLERTSMRLPQDVLKLIRLGLTADPSTRPSASEFAAAVDDVMRRRGVASGADRTARHLLRLDLVTSSHSDQRAREPGARPTGIIEPSELSCETRRLVGQVGTVSPAIYRVRLDDGSTLGPIDLPALVRLIIAARMHPSTTVSKLEGPFRPASALPELERFVTSRALTWDTDEMLGATRRGTLGAARLLPIVHRIASRRETGALYLVDENRRKKIYFVDGRADFVASTEHAELLGEFLVSHDVCLRMEVDMALALLPRYRGRLGDALVGLGVLRPGQLFRAVSEQVRERYLAAFRWRTGEWAFVPKAESGEETYPLGHTHPELMRDAVLEAHPAELEAALEPVRERVLTRVPAPPVRLDAYRLPGTWRRLLAVRGDTTFAKIVARESACKGADLEEVYRAFYLGLSCELVRAA